MQARGPASGEHAGNQMAGSPGRQSGSRMANCHTALSILLHVSTRGELLETYSEFRCMFFIVHNLLGDMLIIWKVAVGEEWRGIRNGINPEYFSRNIFIKYYKYV